MYCVCLRTLVVSDSFATPWTVAFQAPLSVGFSRQECWSGLPCPPEGDFPDPWIEPASFRSPALAGGFFTTGTTWETLSFFLLSFFCFSFFFWQCHTACGIPASLTGTESQALGGECSESQPQDCRGTPECGVSDKHL